MQKLEELLLNGFHIYFAHETAGFYVRAERADHGIEWLVVKKNLEDSVAKIHERAVKAGILQNG